MEDGVDRLFRWLCGNEKVVRRGLPSGLVAVCGFSVEQRRVVLGYLWVVVGSAGCWQRRWKEKVTGAGDGIEGFRRDFLNFCFFSDIFSLDFSDLSCIKVMELVLGESRTSYCVE